MHINPQFFSSLTQLNQRVKRELKRNKPLSVALMVLCTLPSLSLIYDWCTSQKPLKPSLSSQQHNDETHTSEDDLRGSHHNQEGRANSFESFSNSSQQSDDETHDSEDGDIWETRSQSHNPPSSPDNSHLDQLIASNNPTSLAQTTAKEVRFQSPFSSHSPDSENPLFLEVRKRLSFSLLRENSSLESSPKASGYNDLQEIKTQLQALEDVNFDLLIKAITYESQFFNDDPLFFLSVWQMQRLYPQEDTDSKAIAKDIISKLSSLPSWDDGVQDWVLNFADGSLDQEEMKLLITCVKNRNKESFSSDEKRHSFKTAFSFFELLANHGLVKPYYQLINHLDEGSLDSFDKNILKGIETKNNILSSSPLEIQFLYQVACFFHNKRQKEALTKLLRIELKEKPWQVRKACLLRYHYQHLHKTIFDSEANILKRGAILKEVREYVDHLFQVRDFKTAYTLLKGDITNVQHQNGFVFKKGPDNHLQVRNTSIPERSQNIFFFLKLAMLQLYKREALEDESLYEALKQEQTDLLLSLKVHISVRFRQNSNLNQVISCNVDKERAFEAIFQLMEYNESLISTGLVAAVSELKVENTQYLSILRNSSANHSATEPLKNMITSLDRSNRSTKKTKPFSSAKKPSNPIPSYWNRKLIL